MLTLITEDAERAITSFFDPGETPVIPRVGEYVEAWGETFVVDRVIYGTRDVVAHWRDGHVRPGDNPGHADAVTLTPGITEVWVKLHPAQPQ